MGFLHVRVADVWSSELVKQLRTFAGHAGPDLLAEFDSRFVPAPSDIESVTVVLYDLKMRDPFPVGRPTDMTPVWVVTTKKPLDRDALLKTLGKNGKTRKIHNKEYLFDEKYWAGLLVLDDRTYAYASEDSITALIDRMTKGGDSPLAALFAREAGKHPATLAVNVAASFKPEMVKAIPEGLHPLFKAKTWLATLDLEPKTTLSLALEFATEAEAKDGLKAAQEGVQMARGFIGNALMQMEKKARRDPARPQVGIQEFPEMAGFLLAAAGLKQLDGILGGLPIEVKGSAVRSSLVLDGIVPGGGLALSASLAMISTVYSIEAGGPRGGLSPGSYDWTERERNLQNLARAVEKYRNDKGHYPPPAITDKNGKALLSWRVAILPYMENTYISGSFEGKAINGPGELYRLFKLDEPWDSPHNKKLIDKVPGLYRAPYGVLSYTQMSVGKTTTLAVVGKGAIFDPTKKGVSTTDVRDGTNQTLLLVALEEPEQAVYWTKPADIALTAEGKLPADALDLTKRFAVVYADASPHTLMGGLPEKVFLGIVTRDGSEKLDAREIRPEPIKPKGR
jgi:hypothetical protein